MSTKAPESKKGQVSISAASEPSTLKIVSPSTSPIIIIRAKKKNIKPFFFFKYYFLPSTRKNVDNELCWVRWNINNFFFFKNVVFAFVDGPLSGEIRCRQSYDEPCLFTTHWPALFRGSSSSSFIDKWKNYDRPKTFLSAEDTETFPNQKKKKRPNCWTFLSRPLPAEKC